MNSTTVPPMPHISNEIPIVSAAGGRAEAYRDPNSPEAIMKKTKELHSQALMDRMYDVNVSPYKESFLNYGPYDYRQSKSNQIEAQTWILTVVFFLFFTCLSYWRKDPLIVQYFLVLLFCTGIVLLVDQ
jgi:hypothetical protein